ncbi:MFS transporter [Verrucomicrobiota bacterium]
MRRFLRENRVTADQAHSLTLITVGAALAMVYVTGTACPARTEFFRAVGADEFHFGLLTGIPLVALFMQFFGAALTNRVRRRKPVFIALLVLGRMLYVPIAFVPLLFPSLPTSVTVMVLIALVAIASALMQLTPPLWYSWMADVIPSKILNRYWGTRQRWMYFTWTGSFFAVAVFTYLVPLPVTVAYPILVVIAVTAGVLDLLLFVWVDEPPNTITRDKPVLETLLAPMKHPEYKTFVVFSCVSMFSVMFAASFMQLYVLKVLHFTVWQATFVWCLSGIGIAVAGRRWGKIADKHGHKPVMAVCRFLKPGIAAVFLLITPRTALWVLPPAMFIDGMLNAGNMVAANGYMLKIAPRENRSMFIAAITGLAGVCGGISAIAAGSFLHASSGFSIVLMGRTWINYHVLFLASFLMRVACAFLIHWVKEKETSHPVHVLNDLRGVWPMRFLRFPVGFYRTQDPEE